MTTQLYSAPPRVAAASPAWRGFNPLNLEEPRRSGYTATTQFFNPHTVTSEFSASESSSFDLFDIKKGQLAPTTFPEAQTIDVAVATRTVSESVVSATPAADHAQMQRGDIAPIARQRVQLLAASYAGGEEQREIVARLEILNRRLLALAPRVSQEQVAALENANDNLLRIRAAREERARRLGLPTSL